MKVWGLKHKTIKTVIIASSLFRPTNKFTDFVSMNKSKSVTIRLDTSLDVKNNEELILDVKAYRVRQQIISE